MSRTAAPPTRPPPLGRACQGGPDGAGGRAVDCEAVAEGLVTQGFGRLVLQIGSTGTYVPHRLLPAGEARGVHRSGLEVHLFRLVPSLSGYVRDADLVVSHAGAGSLFEALRAGKMVLAVPNGALMDNHQVELASELAARKFLFWCEPSGLESALAALDAGALVPYDPGSMEGVIAAIDASVGW